VGLLQQLCHRLVLVAVVCTLASSADAQFQQQGDKLIGSGAIGGAQQGRAVALSADGKTAVVTGPGDNNSAGAVWVYTRADGVWSQQGGKLVAADAAGLFPGLGLSVALSADGSTVIVGGPNDTGASGAAWVFTRANGVWTQQGPKLFGTGAKGNAYQGVAVGLAADGNTAIVGGSFDNNTVGAAWVFTRANGVWTQQGPKLVGAGANGNAYQGTAVALTGDGNTAILGGNVDRPAGAAWVFTRTNGVWTQQGPKLVGGGVSVALSADGNTAISGSLEVTGGAFVFTRTNDIWTQQGPELVGADAIGYAGQAIRLRCPVTGIPHSWAVLGTTMRWGLPGCSAVSAVSGSS
jgi:hypothetical protein